MKITFVEKKLSCLTCQGKGWIVRQDICCITCRGKGYTEALVQEMPLTDSVAIGREQPA